MGLRIAVQQKQRRPAAARDEVDLDRIGRDAIAGEAFEQAGHVSLLRVARRRKT
jgi:hypothetical protein